MGNPHQVVFRRDYVGASLRPDNEQEHPLITIYHNPRCSKSRATLIERPIVANGEKVTLGRPPENVLGIL